MVTALMPVKRFHPEFLLRAADSLRRQTSPNWRLSIVVERGGLRKIGTLLAGPLADPRVELVVNTGRKLAGAINTGMRQAKTKFVAILLGDDRWAENAVEVLIRNIHDHPRVDFFYSSRRRIDENDQPISPVYTAVESFRLEEFQRWSPVKHLLCWKRATGLAAGGLDESLNSVGPDDYDFPWTMAEHGAVFRAVPECLYLYREHLETFRLTTHLPLSVHKRELWRIYRKHGVPAAGARAAIAVAENGYLRQCLYRTWADQKARKRSGDDPGKAQTHAF
jgi:glycosyltransferase involved in cell wall biosynthesis